MRFSLLYKFILASLIFNLAACQMSTTTRTDRNQPKPAVSPEVAQKYQHALQLMELDNLDAALKVFDGVSKMDDSLSGPYANRGLIYLKSEDYDSAEKAFGDAIQRNPSNVVAHNQLGIIKRQKKQFVEAREHYEAALAVDSNHPNAHLNLGLLCDIYLQDKQCALEHYQAYQQLNKQDEEINNWVIDLKSQL